MKPLLFVLSLAACLMLSGCSPDGPLVKGDIINCKLWEGPRPRQGEIGSSSFNTFTSGRIEIYERFIVVTESNGVKHAAPLDWNSEVSFK
jgi:hypothetical protein